MSTVLECGVVIVGEGGDGGRWHHYRWVMVYGGYGGGWQWQCIVVVVMVM